MKQIIPEKSSEKVAKFLKKHSLPIYCLKKMGILIKIKDNGIGIDPKFHEKIFEKFVQLGNQKHSNGLGLTITKKLVDLHNGIIKVNSKPQNGSEFTVNLPL